MRLQDMLSEVSQTQKGKCCTSRVESKILKFTESGRVVSYQELGGVGGNEAVVAEG